MEETGFEYLLELLGSVALLLWATRMVRTGVLRAFGSELRGFVARTTASPIRACLTGVGVAASVQSATATGLLAASFAEQRILALAPALALMLGADIGSTVVVQLLSFDLSAVMPVLFLFGVGLFTLSDKSRTKQLGRVGIGLGLILVSLSMISGLSEPLRESDTLRVVLTALSGDLALAVIIATLLTWLAHSSVAMVLLFVSLAASGVVSTTLGLALVLGANIGGALVFVGLTFKSGAAPRRIALGNLCFRALGALVLLPLLGMVQPWLGWIEGDAARQLANFHMGFNLALALVFLPLCNWAASALKMIIKDQANNGSEGEMQPRYLDQSAIGVPAVALSQATREVMRMSDLVESMLSRLIVTFEEQNRELIKDIGKTENQVDCLYQEIKLYLTKVSRGRMNLTESQTCMNLMTFATNLEHIGDIIDKNLLELATKKDKRQIQFSSEGWEELKDIHTALMGQMQLAMTVFINNETDLARDLVVGKDNFRDLENRAREAHLDRLREGRPESIDSSTVHLDMLRDFKRIASHLTSVAYPILESTGELRPTRLTHLA